jgi:hypothetical protein
MRKADVLTITLLVLGGFALLIGWFVGVARLWKSATWSTPQKVIGTLFLPGGLATPVLLGSLPASCPSGGETVQRFTAHAIVAAAQQTCGSSAVSVTGIALIALLFVLPVVSGGYLLAAVRKAGTTRVARSAPQAGR